MAKRPKHYDVLLRIRQLQQDLQGQALATAHRAVNTAQEQREQLVEQRTQLISEAGAKAQHHFDPLYIRSYYQYERHLARLVDEKDAEISALQAQAERQRAELEAAMKRRRIIERLRERKLQTYSDDVRREEQKISDEAATNSAAFPRGRQGASKEHKK